MIEPISIFLIGAQKAGTTSLVSYLDQHPQLCFGKSKEVHYFVEDRFYTQGPSYLEPFYSNCGEARPALSYVHMLPSSEAPKRVFNYNPEARFIVVLRNPIDRAYSAFWFARARGWEKDEISFMQSKEYEAHRLKGSYTERYELAYFRNGLYYEHLSNWLSHFSQDRFHFILSDELHHDPGSVLKDVCEFLGLASYDFETSRKANSAAQPKWKGLNRFLLNKENPLIRSVGKLTPQRVRLWLRKKVVTPVIQLNMEEGSNPPLNEEDRKVLSTFYARDVSGLSSLLGRDLNSLWEINPHID